MHIRSYVFACALFAAVLNGGARAGVIQFHPPKPYSLQTLYQQALAACPKKVWTCLENELYDFTMIYGPRSAIQTFSLLQSRGDVPQTFDPHHVAHHIGHHTAMAFGPNIQAYDLCPPDYDYGCMHGFFQYSLSQGGMTEAAAAKICESVAAEPNTLSKTKFECYHGLGHGIMMHEHHELMPALRFCDHLKSAVGQDGCQQGVFMENVDVAEAGQWKKGGFSMQDPLAPCDKLDARYQRECFINHSGWLMRFFGNDMARGSLACLQAPPPDLDTCLQTLGLLVTNAAWQPALMHDDKATDFAHDAWTLCKKFPSGYVGNCVVSALDNIMNSNILDAPTVIKAQSFCAAVSERYHAVCYRQIGADLTYLAPDAKTAHDACLFLKGEAAQTQCISRTGS